MSETSTLISIFKTHKDAEKAIKLFHSSGFDMKIISIVGKGRHTKEQVIGICTSGTRIKFWSKLGAFWGGLFGLLFGSALFTIPGIGHIIILGPLAGWILGALEGAAVGGGLTALGAALYNLGIPKHRATKYESAIKSDQYMIIAHGKNEVIQKAKEIIDKTKAVETYLYRT
jgi:hypothetical protein